MPHIPRHLKIKSTGVPEPRATAPTTNPEAQQSLLGVIDDLPVVPPEPRQNKPDVERHVQQNQGQDGRTIRLLPTLSMRSWDVAPDPHMLFGLEATEEWYKQ